MRRLSLKEKLYRSLKGVVPADDIYTGFIRFKPEEQKKEVMELLKSYAKADNTDLELRSKCLSCLGWYKSVGCDNEVSKYYEYLKVICDDTEIPEIIAENCIDLMERIKKRDTAFLKETNLLEEIILLVGDYKLKTPVTRNYFKFIEDYLSLKEKFKKGALSENETYIYDQINRIKKELKY